MTAKSVSKTLGISLLAALTMGCQGWKNHRAFQGGPPTADKPKRHWGRVEAYPQLTVTTPTMVSAPPPMAVAGPPPNAGYNGPPPVANGPNGPPPAIPAMSGPPPVNQVKYAPLGSGSASTPSPTAAPRSAAAAAVGATETTRRAKPADDRPADADELVPPSAGRGR